MSMAGVDRLASVLARVMSSNDTGRCRVCDGNGSPDPKEHYDTCWLAQEIRMARGEADWLRSELEPSGQLAGPGARAPAAIGAGGAGGALPAGSSPALPAGGD